MATVKVRVLDNSLQVTMFSDAGILNVAPTVDSTTEAISFTVDFNDAGAVDPPSTTTFRTQSDVDNFLLSQGATNFKHMQPVYDAFADDVNAQLIMNLAAGVQRPVAKATQGGIDAMVFNTKRLNANISDGTLRIVGAPPADWTVQVATQTITVVDTTAGAPAVTVSGTPYVAGALKGFFAEFDTGQISAIYDNTSSVINLCSSITGSPTTVTIKTPSTIIRNSLVDGQTEYTSTFWRISTLANGGSVHMQDLTIDPAGAFFGINMAGSLVQTRCLMDRRTHSTVFGQNVNGTSYFLRPVAPGLDSTRFNQCSHINFIQTSASALDRIFDIGNGLLALALQCYAQGSEDGVIVQRGGNLTWRGSVFDEIGSNFNASESNEGYVQAVDGGGLFFFWFFSGDGTFPRIRNCQATAGNPNRSCLFFEGNAWTTQKTGHRLVFEGNAVDCIRMGKDGKLPQFDANVNYSSGVGNTGAGVKLSGPHALLNAGSNFLVTGSVGDIEEQDGTVVAYATVSGAGRQSDTSFNVYEVA